MTVPQLQIRAVVGLSILLGILGALFVRLFQVQVLQSSRWADRADAQQWTRIETVPPVRGQILDRNGRAFARTETSPTVAIDPAAMGQAKPLVARLVRETLGVSAQEFEQILARGSRNYAYVRRQVSDRAAVERLKARAKAAGLACFVWEEEPRRVHPQGALAAHVVGFTDRDGKGLEGVERLLDARLAGTPGRRVTLRDARAQRIVTASQPVEPAVDGLDVRLTLDSVVQAFAEDAAQRSYEKHAPKGTVAAVVDVATGEILGLACRPAFDPASPGAAAADARRNRFFTDIFEPGSTFKPLVMAAALDSGAVRPTDTFDCDANRIGRRTIHEDEGHRYGVQTPEGIIARSSNVGMAQVGVRLGIPRAHAAVRLFGFGTRTALAWPGESNGQVEPLKSWSTTYTLVSVAFGHNIAVTPAQLLMSYAALANDGLRLEPRLCADAPPASAPVRVVSPQTAALMRPMLEAVLDRGTASFLKKAEYRIGGKTGTAQKLGTGGVVASFACFGPIENPRLAVLVVCDEPRKNGHHGSVCAAPYAVDLLRSSLRYLGVPRSGGTAPEAVGPADEPLVTADVPEESER